MLSFSLGFSLLLLLLQPFKPALIYLRDPILAGEAWRLWSASLVHVDYAHLALNLTGFWLLMFLCSTRFNLKFLIFSIFLGASSVGPGLLLFHPGVQWYAGFSGVLYGLFLCGGILSLLARDHLTGLLLTGLPLAKVLTDGWIGGSPLTEALLSTPVLEQSHGYGMGAGLLALVLAHLPRLWGAAAWV